MSISESRPKGYRREERKSGAAEGKSGSDWPVSKTSPAGRPIAILGVLILIVTTTALVTHWPVLSAQAQSFDDCLFLTDNWLVQNPSWNSAWRFLSEVHKPSTIGGYYHPLSMISLMLDYAAGGRADNMLPFHRTSLALHLINTALVIVLLYMLFGYAWPAALAGLLFALHPLTVEPIAWLGERKTLLAGFFALWAMVFYLWYVRKSDPKLLGAVVVMYLLGVMSKPTIIPLPILLLVLDYWPLGRLSLRAVLEKIPLYAITCVSAATTLVLHAETATLEMSGKESFLEVPLMICYLIIFYFRKIVWPGNLSSVYVMPEPWALSNLPVLLSLIAVLVLLVLLVISGRGRRAFVAGFLFFLVAISPTLGVIEYSWVIASDKYVYVPCLGILMVTAWGLAMFWRSAKGNLQCGLIVLAVALLAGAEAFGTRNYLGYWQDREKLFARFCSLAPKSPNALSGLGAAMIDKGQIDKAIKCYTKAIRLDPDLTTAYDNLAVGLFYQKKYDRVIEVCSKALRRWPGYPGLHYRLALALAQKGRTAEAIAQYKQAITIRPDWPDAHWNLGNALLKQKKYDQALEHYAETLRLNRNHYSAYFNTAEILALQGKYRQAIIYYNQTLELKPDHYKAHAKLADVLVQLGRNQDAIAQYNKSLDLNQDYALAHRNLGIVLASQNNIAQAIKHYSQVLRIEGPNANTHCFLGDLYVRIRKFRQAVSEYRAALQIDADHAKARQRLKAVLSKPQQTSEQSNHLPH